MFKKITIIMTILFISLPTFAAGPTSYAGYSVDGIIHNTIKLFETKKLMDYSATAGWYRYEVEAEDQCAHGMLPVFPFMNFEQSLLNYCIYESLITRDQAQKAIDDSKNYGGLTINGYNLLVLHAAILGTLAENKHITLKEAQALLDSSKEKK